MADDKNVSVSIGGTVDPSVKASMDQAAAAIGTIPKAAQDAQAQVAASMAAMSASFQQATRAIQQQTFDMNVGFQRLRETLENLPSGANRAAAGIAKVSHSGTNNRAIMESLVLVHEVMSGRFTRLAGSSLILTQALAGEEAIAGAVALALSPVGLAVIAVTGATLAGAAIAYQYAEAQAAVTRAVVGVGAASGVSAEQLNKLAETGAAGFKSSVGENREALEAFTGAGVRNKTTLAELTGATADFAALTGQKAAPAVAELAKAMADPAKGAQDLNEKFSFLDATQLRQIQTMAQLGDKSGAQAELAHLLAQRTDEAAKAAGGLQNWFHSLLTGASDLGNEIGKLITHFGDLAQAENRGYGDPTAGAKTAVAAAQRRAQLKQDSAGGADLEAATPEAQAQSQKNQLQGDVNTVSKALAADTQLYGPHSEAVKRDSEALAEYTRALNTYMSPAQKAHEVALLDIQIADTKNASLKAQLETQKEQIALSGEVMTAAEAAQRAQDAGALKGAKTKTHDDSYSVAEAALNQQIASEKDAYADRAQIAEAYWAKVLATTSAGGAQRRQMENAYNQARIEVQKETDAALIADDEYQITKAKDNPQAYAAAWAKILDDVKRIHGANSADFLNVERRNQDAIDATLAKQREEAARYFEKQAQDETRQNSRQTSTADEAISGKENEVKDQRSDGLISSQQEVAALTALNQQREALAEASAQKELEIAQAKDEKIIFMEGATNSEIVAALQDEVAAYDAAEQAKTDAVQKAANRQTQIQQQAAKAQADAYKASVSQIVDTVGSGFLGMARGTETFGQLGIKVAEQLENQFVASIEKMIVSHIVGESTKTAATLAGQTAQTGATVAGTTARTAAEQTAQQQGLLLDFEATVKKVTNAAASAAAGAYQAFASVPLIGPALGAAAAAVTFTAVEAFGALASAEGGYSIPSGVNPLVQAHAEEMVLPANLSNGFRNIIANQQSGGSGGSPSSGSGSGGDTYHMAFNSLDSRSVKSYVRQAGVARSIASAARGRV